MRYVMAIILSLSVFSLGLAPMPAFAAGEPKVTMDQLPAPVKATIEKEAKGGTVADIVRDTEKGKSFYEAHITLPNGKDRYVHVADDGKVLKRESAKKEAKNEAKEEKKAEKAAEKANR